MRHVPRLALVTLVAGILTNCGGEAVAPGPIDEIEGPALANSAVEGELLGNVYDGTGLSTETGLYFNLIPFDQATIASLSGTNFSQSLWINPSSGFSIEYFNPEADGPTCGGSYSNYLSNNLAGTAAEAHDSGPGSGPPGGFERHCIIPGTYRAELWRGETILKSFLVDYIPSKTVAGGAPIATATDDNTQLTIESPTFDPANTLLFPDLVVNFHLNPPSGYTDTSVLEIENAQLNINKSTFTKQSSPSGKVTDWFRYRTDKSTGNWTLGTRGQKLMGIWWDNNNPAQRSGFFDHAERPILRVHKYEGEVTAPTTVTAGLEVKRPDEGPASQPAVTKNISILVDPQPVACATFEGTTTWRNTDQFFDASCSSNGTLQYRWDTGSGYGPYSSNPLFEFFGHSSSGTKTVSLQVKNTAVSPPTTNIKTYSITVSSTWNTISGPSYVTNKTLKTYSAPTSSSWWERYDPATLTTWYLTLSSGSQYNRIWPAGDYTRGLRAQKLSGPPGLGRGRLDVVVCHESIPNCSGPPPAEWVLPDGVASHVSAPTEDHFSIFGAGPWITTGNQIWRFYDLTGWHEPNSPFANIAWIGTPSGSAVSADGAFEVRWQRVESFDPNVRVVDFNVTPRTTDTYRFGFAVDPDLGHSPADDISGYDPDRGLVFATDGKEAVGFVLRSRAGHGISAVDQYGARHFAPRSAEDARRVGESAGQRLTSEADDVQFVVSGEGVSGAGSWRLIVVRAPTAGLLRTRLDSLLEP